MTKKQVQPRIPTAQAPLNGPDVPVEDKQRELEGRRPADRQEAYLELDQLERREGLNDTQIYEGELESGSDGDDLSDESLDQLTELELRDGETDDPIEASDEGEPYVPPIDPPVVPGDDDNLEGAEIASGTGVSSLDEPYDEDHHSEFLVSDDEMSARVRDALLADSSTSHFARQIHVSSVGGVVTLRGTVDDLDDSDNAAAVAEFVEGVVEVNEQLKIRALQ